MVRNHAFNRFASFECQCLEFEPIQIAHETQMGFLQRVLEWHLAVKSLISIALCCILDAGMGLA
jgi:hypothetical protein